MRAKKKFNNNVVMTKNKNNQEIILIGNGLAFNIRPGDIIDESKIEKIFVLDNGSQTDSFADFLCNVPPWQLKMTQHIIEYATSFLGVELNNYIYLTLTDHITYALKRHEKGEDISNPLLWEIKKIYPKEYEAALYSLDIIKDCANISLKEDEAGFIALHFINAQQGQIAINETMQVPKIVKEIIHIVEYHFAIELDKSSMSYDRFLVHLKFFAQRILEKDVFTGNEISMMKDISKKWPKSYTCVEKIYEYIKKHYNVEIGDDEKFYLMTHIQRVTSRNNNI